MNRSVSPSGATRAMTLPFAPFDRAGQSDTAPLPAAALSLALSLAPSPATQRAKLMTALRPFACQQLESFLEAALEDSAVLQALSGERNVRYIHPREGRRRLTVTATETSVRAAEVAQRYRALLPHERPVAGVGAFFYGLGAYHLYRTYKGRLNLPPLASALALAREERLQLLADPLRALRSSAPGLGSLMTEVLGQRIQEHTDRQQVSRVFTAVRLANLRTEQAWLGPALIF